jgi:hypothetical protein
MGGVVLASDTFTRANETPVASPWVQLAGSTGTINLSGNAIQLGTAGDNFYYYSGPAWSAAQYSKAVMVTAPANDDFGPAVRIGSNGFSGYYAAGFEAGPVFVKFVAGTGSGIGSLTLNLVNGDTFGSEIVGSTLRCKLNGAEPTGSPVTDTELTTAGNGAGMEIFGSGGAIDNWEGGDFGAAGFPYDYSKFPKHKIREAVLAGRM